MTTWTVNLHMHVSMHMNTHVRLNVHADVHARASSDRQATTKMHGTGPNTMRRDGRIQECGREGRMGGVVGMMCVVTMVTVVGVAMVSLFPRVKINFRNSYGITGYKRITEKKREMFETKCTEPSLLQVLKIASISPNNFSYEF